jgi:hypothetical protein
MPDGSGSSSARAAHVIQTSVVTIPTSPSPGHARHVRATRSPIDTSSPGWIPVDSALVRRARTSCAARRLPHVISSARHLFHTSLLPCDTSAAGDGRTSTSPGARSSHAAGRLDGGCPSSGGRPDVVRPHSRTRSGAVQVVAPRWAVDGPNACDIRCGQPQSFPRSNEQALPAQPRAIPRSSPPGPPT